jgi:hypothetical protein
VVKKAKEKEEKWKKLSRFFLDEKERRLNFGVPKD